MGVSVALASVITAVVVAATVAASCTVVASVAGGFGSGAMLQDEDERGRRPHRDDHRDHEYDGGRRRRLGNGAEELQLFMAPKQKVLIKLNQA